MTATTEAETLAARAMFTVGSQTWTWQDVLVSVAADPASAVGVQRFLAGCEAHQRAAGREPDGDACQAVVDAVRYHLGLETAQAVGRWLETWSLTADDLASFATREVLWLDAYLPPVSLPGPEELVAYPQAAWQHVHCRGALRRWLQPALRQALSQDASADEATIEPLCRLHAPSLLSFDYHWLHFRDGDTAAEARCCLIHDHERPAALAARIAAPCLEGTAVLADWPEAWQAALRSTAPGMATHPLADLYGASIISIDQKQAADPAHTTTRERVIGLAHDQLVVGRSNEIQWHIPLEPAYE